jgi:hypothetical protein
VSPAKSFQPIERTHSTAYISSTSVKREQYKPTETANAGTIHDAYKLTVGMKIAHPRFGTGVITEIDAANPTGARIIVNFSNIDIKTLLLKFAKFTIIE